MINLKDKLSHLTYKQACKMLGAKGEKLIRQGGKYEIDLNEQVVLRRNIFQLNLGELDVLIDHLMSEQDRKIVLFSEWTTMLNLIEPLLNKRELDYVRLDGSVPQKKRQGLIHQFQKNPECKLFITTNAGSTGLNLQAANTVINVDLP